MSCANPVNCFGRLVVTFCPHWLPDRLKVRKVRERREDLKKELGPKDGIGFQVVEALESTYPYPSYQWNISHGHVGDNDILQTPPKDQWTKNVVDHGHSQFFPDRVKQEIEGANRWVDILSLSPPKCQDPDLTCSEFDKAICDAIETLATRSMNEGPITVRLLFAEVPLETIDVQSLRNKFIKKVRNMQGVNLHVWVGAYRRWTSWNHSKIIAVDGKRVMFGGHNMWDGDLLYKNPVHDLSLVVRGDVAQDAHLFADKLWDFLSLEANRRGIHFFTHAQISQWPEQSQNTPAFWANLQRTSSDEPGPRSLFITVGRLGQIGRFGFGRWGRGNPSDVAITALLKSAKRRIRLSQQDIGPPTKKLPWLCCGITMTWPWLNWVDEYLNEIANALRRGVKVEIVVSNEHSGNYDKYGSGWTADDIAAQIVTRVIHFKRKPLYRHRIDEDFEQKIKERLCVTYIRRGRGEPTAEGKERTSEAARWSGPCIETTPTARYTCEKPIANHVKLILVDDKSYYLGSQNLYMCDLAEWGAIVLDPGVASKLYEEYWAPMWEQSWDEGKDWGDCNYSQVIKDSYPANRYPSCISCCHPVVQLQQLLP